MHWVVVLCDSCLIVLNGFAAPGSMSLDLKGSWVGAGRSSKERYKIRQIR